MRAIKLTVKKKKERKERRFAERRLLRSRVQMPHRPAYTSRPKRIRIRSTMYDDRRIKRTHDQRMRTRRSRDLTT